jgi:hypothetical protein
MDNLGFSPWLQIRLAPLDKLGLGHQGDPLDRRWPSRRLAEDQRPSRRALLGKLGGFSSHLVIPLELNLGWLAEYLQVSEKRRVRGINMAKQLGLCGGVSACPIGFGTAEGPEVLPQLGAKLDGNPALWVVTTPGYVLEPDSYPL